MMVQEQTTPRVWIGCLAAYNAGHLHGEWCDATEGLEALEAARAEILRTSPADFPEETFLADREGFGDLLGEYDSLALVAELAEVIEEHGEAFIAYVDNMVGTPWGSDVAGLVEGFEDSYCGEFGSLREYAEELVDECGWAGLEPSQLETIGPYLDMDKIARDLDFEGYCETGGYVFRPC